MKRTGHFFEVFAHLAPEEDVNGDREPFKRWYARVQHHLPQHLPEAVVEDWLYEHWDSESEFSDLDLNCLRFRQDRWPSARLLAIRVGSLWGEDVGQPLLTDYWVGEEERRLYMEEHGTWRSPILVLEHPEDPLLIEGHNRLAVARVLVTLGKALPEHEVWVATSV